MEDKRYTFIDKTLSTYNFATIQSLKMILAILEQDAISRDELNQYIDLKAFAIANNRPVGVVCLECKAPMALEYVNISPRTVTGDDSKIVYTCMNQNCMNQIFE